MTDNMNEQAIIEAVSEEKELNEELPALNFEQALEAVLFAAGHPQMRKSEVQKLKARL